MKYRYYVTKDGRMVEHGVERALPDHSADALNYLLGISHHGRSPMSMNREGRALKKDGATHIKDITKRQWQKVINQGPHHMMNVEATLLFWETQGE